MDIANFRENHDSKMLSFDLSLKCYNYFLKVNFFIRSKIESPSCDGDTFIFGRKKDLSDSRKVGRKWKETKWQDFGVMIFSKIWNSDRYSRFGYKGFCIENCSDFCSNTFDLSSKWYNFLLKTKKHIRSKIESPSCDGDTFIFGRKKDLSDSRKVG